MIAFIDDHRGVYGVEPICRVLRIAPSTYHAHAAVRADPAKGSARSRRDGELRAVYSTHRGQPFHAIVGVNSTPSRAG